ncbi:MAG TPA: glutaminase A [Solirubrobacterales bacterium]|jgi:glutaminase|nr:glutaminase A [Solirubrobacterales bacterium]
MSSSPIDAYLQRLHERWQADGSGAVADYIPPLALADPESFGIAVATTDGHCYEVGESRRSFTIQSISKPFTYGLALRDLGLAAVDAKVGVEPTGDAFNSISLAPDSGRPLNPMINAGAITSTSLVAGGSAAEREQRLLAAYGSFAGRPLAVETAVYESERDTGHRNRAIGHMLRSFGILEDDPEAALDLYFRQCSVAVDCRDLSLMAATLANGGVHPLTGERALEREYVDRVLSVMTTCGMYDSAGEWVVDVGMPAKSGVAGGVLAVLPGQLGIAVYSPPLDPHGNSVRGIEVCRQISTDLNLNLLHVARSSRSAVRRSYTVADIPSRRRRPAEQSEVLARVGSRCVVHVLHGDLVFAATESVIRTLVEQCAEIDLAIVDLAEVTEIDVAARRLLAALGAWMAESGRELVLVAPAHGDLLGDLPTAVAQVFADLDAATEWCEERLLAAHGAPSADRVRVPLAEQRLARGLEAAMLARLGELLRPRSFVAGETIFAAGDPADAIFLLVEGEVTIEIEFEAGKRRLATLTPGLAFGEVALADFPVRPASVHAETAGECLALTVADFNSLSERDPALQAALMRNLLASFYEVIGRMTREVGSLFDGR